MNDKVIRDSKRILAQARRKKVETPKDESNLLNWNFAEVNAYIKANTKKMSLKKKLKFGDGLIKRIAEAKAKANIKQ